MARYSNLFIKKVYREMLRIRQFEKSLIDPILSKEIETPCHLCIGQEAVAVGICQDLNPDDYVFGNHRSHGHYLAKGGNMNALAAEIYGKTTGCCKGFGGSMHLLEIKSGFMGAVPIISATIPMAVGAALKFKMDHEPRVVVSFFGDGATNEGIFYESMNFAALHSLPILFVCENNLYSTHVPIRQHCAVERLKNIASPFMHSEDINGNNVFQVYTKAKDFIDECRNGKGPFFMECQTYRLCGHVGPDDNVLGDHKDIRPESEIKEWEEKDPLKNWEKYISETELKEIQAEVLAAHEFARNSNYPDEEELGIYVY